MPPAFDGGRPCRRRLLRTGGAALATGLSSLGAGCSSLPPLGTEIRYGSVDVPKADPPTYRDWLPAPSAFPNAAESAEGYHVLVHATPPACAPDWARGSLPRALVVAATDYVGFHVDDADVVVGTDTSAVLVGDVDLATVRDTLARTIYERAGTDGDYDVYARPDRDRVVGVGPDAVVFGTGSAARGSLEATIRAGRGEVPRYHESDADVATLTDSVGMRRWAWHWPGGIGRSTAGDVREDTVGWATAFDYRGQSGYFVETWVFPESDDPTVATIKGALKQEGPSGGLAATEATAVDISVEGQVATIAMYLAPDVAQEELAGGARPVPYTTWRATDGGAEHLTVRHDAGDPVGSDQLTVTAPGLSVPAADAGDVGDRIEPGDELTVSTADLDAGDTVRLVFHDPTSPSSSTLFTHELP